MIAAAPAEEPPGPAAQVRRPPDSLEELLERQADDARALSGARSSAWNGRVGWLPAVERPQPRAVVGLADWDGTIYYDRAYVQRPLQALFSRAGDLESHELWHAKNALAVVLHENCHLLASDPEDHQLTRASWSLPLVMLEEGSTELFAQSRLDAYVRRLGLDRLAPGLTEVEAEASYPLFVPAVRTLTQGVGRLTGQTGPEVLRQVICEAGAKKFQTLGGIVLTGSGVAARIPERDREAAAAGISDAVREAFGDVARLGFSLPLHTSLQLSRRTGREALRRILLELETLDAHYPPEEAMRPARCRRARTPEAGREHLHARVM